jgi:hypothetical protein
MRQLSAGNQGGQRTFFTLRMSLTALVLAACGPPLAIVAEISSLYILQVHMHVCQSTPDRWLPVCQVRMLYLRDGANATRQELEAHIHLWQSESTMPI